MSSVKWQYLFKDPPSNPASKNWKYLSALSFVIDLQQRPIKDSLTFSVFHFAFFSCQLLAPTLFRLSESHFAFLATKLNCLRAIFT